MPTPVRRKTIYWLSVFAHFYGLDTNIVSFSPFLVVVNITNIFITAPVTLLIDIKRGVQISKLRLSPRM